MRWPAALEDEYRALLHRKYTVGMDATEAARFQAIKDEMSAIEMADPVVQRNLARMRANTAALKRLRKEVEAAIAEASQ